MQQFSGRGSARTDDKWFSVGQIDVTTTILVTAISTVWLLIWAVEGPSRSISRWFEFDSALVLTGQVWRLITWPLVSSLGFDIISIYIFYSVGSHLEPVLGRVRQLKLLAYFTLLPALFMTLIDAVSSISGTATGLYTIVLGLLIVFVLYRPGTRSFFGIPMWILLVAIIGFQILSSVYHRDYYSLALSLILVGTALIVARAFGLAPEADWIPRIDLPSSMGGDPRYKSPRRAKRTEHLKIVKAQEELQDDIAQIEIDAILDQVSEGGMDSLSKDQRRTLERYSKQQRKKKGR